MAQSWGSVLFELIPLALLITVSPLSIIPAILALQTSRPKPAGLAYTGGWLLGLAALTAVFTAVSGLLGGFDKPPGWAPWLRIGVGAAVVVFGVLRWLTRHRTAHVPAWMRQITTATPAKTGAIGTLLAVVNPKVVFICAASGLAIGEAGLGAARAWTAVVYFVLVAGSSVALPVLAFAASGDRIDRPLSRLKDWMEHHHASLLAAVLIVIGLLLIYEGVHAL
jgi:threonine/homoserine/homoserine lactone efflux protein